jgi:hypothetical protein
MGPRSSFRRPIGYLLAADLFLGLAHIALLPAWEGFDERAHYSYLQQLVDTWTLPRWGQARISKAVEDYARTAPLPYTSVAPFDANGGLTYRALLLESSREAVSRAYALVHEPPSTPRRYQPGVGWNWEVQHPPLYYLILAPVYLATRQLSWAEHLFALRLTSYFMAWLALAIGVYACATTSRAFGGSRASQEAATLGIALWPVLMPAWFPDMARLGNDSLSALILAGVWLISVRALGSELSMGDTLALGAALGAGCLTKAFFLPVSIGVLGFWSFRARGLPQRRALELHLLKIALVLLVATGIAGWWYVGNWHQSSAALGLHTSFTQALLTKFTVAQWVRGHAAFLTTIAWCGTWSLARPPYVYLAPLAGMVLVVAGAYAAALRRFPVGSVVWLPAWLVTPLTLGLSYEILVRLAWNGEGRGTNGYYLHFLNTALGAAVGLGLGTKWPQGAFRRVVVGLTVYTVLFEVAVSWAQVMLFSGWLFKAGSNPFYQVPGPLPGFLGLPDVLSRLAILAYPLLGMTAWVIGGMLLLGGLLSAWRASVSFAHAEAWRGPVDQHDVSDVGIVSTPAR